MNIAANWFHSVVPEPVLVTVPAALLLKLVPLFWLVSVAPASLVMPPLLFTVPPSSL